MKLTSYPKRKMKGSTRQKAYDKHDDFFFPTYISQYLCSKYFFLHRILDICIKTNLTC